MSEIAVAASFTADPVVDPLGFWMQALGIDAGVSVAPFGQVFQALLDPASVLAQPGVVLRVLLVRAIDLPGSAVAVELADAIRSAVSRGPAPVLVALCPSPPGTAASFLEDTLVAAFAGDAQVEVVTDAALLALYPVPSSHDPAGDALGAIPYTEAFFAALATRIARAYHARIAAPYKVIVADCDQTLWAGVCGEDGPLGVVVDAPRRALQDLLLAQRAQGMLLCLASKNEDADVATVLREHPDMRLRAEHLVARRVSWRPKSEGLREIATELGLGLDAFVFLDDDPLERAAVRAGCPEVLVPELPRDPAEVPDFLAHLWAFDPRGSTDEDRRRSAFYEAERSRVRVAEEAPSLAVFLEGLALEVTIAPLGEAQIARAAQLTRRTNQLNASTRRRSDAELASALARGEIEGVVVDVRDRFGDYGTVGVALFAPVADALHVDTFLLSCRALGRGVEAKMLAHLGDRARDRGLAEVVVAFISTEKNRPARDLLDSVAASAFDGAAYRFPASTLADVRVLAPPSAHRAAAPAPTRAAPSPSPRASRLARIAAELRDVDAILAAIRAHARRERRSSAPFVAPRTPIEATIARIWQGVLAIDAVGVDDTFFELGGQSVAMIRVVSRIRDELGVDLSPDRFFAGPTIARLARAVEASAAPPATAADLDLSALLDEVDALSDEDARALLAAPSIVAAPRAPLPAAIASIPTKQGDRAPRAPLRTLGIPTRDRPAALERAVASYLENAARHGRALTVAVADDTPDEGARRATRAVLSALGARHRTAIAYAGAEEKRAFVDALIAHGIAAPLARFALQPDPFAASTAGANRNALLLHTAGSAFFSADDDSECRLVAPPHLAGGLRVTSDRDPADHWFFPDRAAALASARFIDADLLGAHEAVLGERVDALIRAHGAPDLHSADPALRGRVEAGVGEVIVSFSGLVGDCGWGAPFGRWRAPMGFLAMEGPSLARLAATEPAFRAACESREIHRLVDRLHVGDAAFSMTTFAALDNRRPLPPFLPLGRGQDNVFGATIELCFPEALFGHLPLGLVHAPVDVRRFWPGELIRSAGGVDLGRVMIECLRAWPSPAERDPEERMRLLGGHVAALGRLPPADFDAFLGDRLRASGEVFITWLDRRLAAERRSPAWWAAEMDRYRRALGEALDRPAYALPLDLRNGASAQPLVARFGELLQAWPDLITATRTLQRAGQPLAIEAHA